jgi:hypothetical protein
MSIKRRPTKDVERLLDVALKNYHHVTTSKRAADWATKRNKEKLVNTAHDIEICWFVTIALCRWTLGIGLTDEERRWVITEIEDELGES